MPGSADTQAWQIDVDLNSSTEGNWLLAHVSLKLEKQWHQEFAKHVSGSDTKNSEATGMASSWCAKRLRNGDSMEMIP